MSKCFYVQLESKNYSERILMQEGTRFENKGKRYTMGSDGELSIFDKETQEITKGNTIELRDYQYQTFKAVMNNHDEKKGIATLSNKDIELSLKQHEKGNVTTDLGEFLKGDYEVENPRRFPNENKLSAYITNGRKSTSAVLAFSYNVVEKATTKPVTPEKDSNLPIESTTPVKPTQGAFTGTGLFNNPNIKEKRAFTYTCKKGDNLVTLAKTYEIDTYQIIAANPQLEKGVDYNVTFPKNGLANLTSNLKPGQKIIIPARYDVKKGSCKSVNDVAKIAGVSVDFLKDFLTIVETKEQNGEPDYKTYLDDGGTPTIGYGHTGRVNGKPLSCRKGKKIRIDKKEALEILAEDLLKHKAMTMAYLGKENYLKAPRSVQDAILDVAYNKGIWDGYLTNQGYAKSTSKIKEDLQKGHYASALVHTRREKTGFRGLRKRNIYRFISGLKDLPTDKRKAAIKAMTSYYKQELAKCKSYDREALRSAWENARQGKCTGYNLK
ncbi:LysM peptidoglycan-binding domain-containing protein [bacterium]|nr:LysM peptidoglycan-binding domain-containing protein [bacterium]